MPGFDRTGPQGQGPRTGRQMGLCNPDSPLRRGETNDPRPVPGQGLAQRRGRGAGGRGRAGNTGLGLARRRGWSGRR